MHVTHTECLSYRQEAGWYHGTMMSRPFLGMRFFCVSRKLRFPREVLM